MSQAPFGPGNWIFQAVVFDMDGVVIENHPAHREAWHGFLRTLDRDVCDHELDYILDGRKREDILRHFWASFLQNSCIVTGQQKVRLQKATLPMKPDAGSCGFPGELREWQVRGNRDLGQWQAYHFRLERLNLRRYFREIVTAEVEVSKPNPAIYRLACERLQFRHLDRWRLKTLSGVLAAKGAGLRCVGLAPDDDDHRLLTAGQT
jgi:beta-phosphoglucomutase-like phosphatase (HAD superfamily)